MPRTNSRKRNNHRNDNTARVSTASNLSPNAPEFTPIGKYNFIKLITHVSYGYLALKLICDRYILLVFMQINLYLFNTII